MIPSNENLPSILIVDDDPTQLYVTRKLMALAGVANPIVERTGGAEAIAYLSSCDSEGVTGVCVPGAIFLDLSMPRTDGIAVLRWIRSNSSLADVRVTMLTSSTTVSDVDLCLSLGANAYIVKHPRPEILIEVLRPLSARYNADASPEMKKAFVHGVPGYAFHRQEPPSERT